MAISNFDRKMEVLGFLVFLYGKLIKMAVIVENKGLDAKEVRKREKEASKVIDQLRSQMFRTWTGQADTLLVELRAINDKAQRKVRELEEAADKVAKLGEALSIIDRAIGLVKGL